MTYNEKISKWFGSAIGKGMNPDGAYGYQCKDVIDDYCIFLFGNWVNTITPGDAYPVYAKSNSAYFTKIRNNPSDANQLPKKGDIIIWGPVAGNPYGHIAVVDSANNNSVTVIQQNGFQNWKPAHKATFAWSSPVVGPVYGWLRPKSAMVKNISSASLGSKRTVKSEYVNYRSKPKLSGKIIKKFDKDAELEFKGYVYGDTYLGNKIWFVGKYTGGYIWSGAMVGGGSTAGLKKLTVAPPNQPDTATPITPAPAPTPTPTPEPISTIPAAVFAKDNLFAIDVSNHQRTMPLKTLDVADVIIAKAGWTGVSYGGLYDRNEDPSYRKFIDYANSKDKLTGAYWYFYPDTEAGALLQAKWFADIVENDTETVLFADLEEHSDGLMTQAAAFIAEVEKLTGKEVFIYANTSFTNKYQLDTFWEANYGSNNGNINAGVSGDAYIHQFTDKGRVGGYNADLDFNIVKDFSATDWLELAKTYEVEQVAYEEPVVQSDVGTESQPEQAAKEADVYEEPVKAESVEPQKEEALSSAMKFVRRLTTQIGAAKLITEGLCNVIEQETGSTLLADYKGWVSIVLAGAIIFVNQYGYKMKNNLRWFW